MFGAGDDIVIDVIAGAVCDCFQLGRLFGGVWGGYSIMDNSIMDSRCSG